MKSKLFVCLTALFLAGSLHSQTVDTRQWAMVSKKTADWCSICGGYGWTMFKNLYEDAQSGPNLTWAVHYSGGLSKPFITQISNNWGGPGQPLFYVNEDEMGVTSGNATAKRAEIKQLVEDLQTFPAVIGAGLKAEALGNRLEVTYKAEFLETLEGGEFYLGLYTMRDNLVSSQAGRGDNAVHNNVLDRNLFDMPFGIKISDNGGAAGTGIENKIILNDFTLHSANLADNKVVAVIWARLANRFAFVNATVVEVEEFSTSTADLGDAKFFAYAQGNQIFVKSTKSLQLENTKLLDIDGRTITSTFVRVDEQTLRAQTAELNTGMYIISTNQGGKAQSTKVFVN